MKVHRSNQELQDTLEGYKMLIEEQKKEIWKLKQIASDYLKIMNGPRKSYRDYPTYKRRFEILRPLFFILAKANLVPMSFYLKYTAKKEI